MRVAFWLSARCWDGHVLLIAGGHRLAHINDESANHCAELPCTLQGWRHSHARVRLIEIYSQRGSCGRRKERKEVQKVFERSRVFSAPAPDIGCMNCAERGRIKLLRQPPTQKFAKEGIQYHTVVDTRVRPCGACLPHSDIATWVLHLRERRLKQLNRHVQPSGLNQSPS